MPISTNAPFNEFGQSMILRDIEQLYLALNGAGTGSPGDGQTQDQSAATSQDSGGLPDLSGLATTAYVDESIAAIPSVTYPISIANGGTGASTPPDARLGVGCIKGITASGSPWTSGTPTFVVPDGVSRILVIVIGGGGGFATGGSSTGTFFYVSSTSGGATNYRVDYSVSGSGGGHGGVAMAWVDVVAGETISMAIGTGGSASYPGGDGGSTTVTFPSSGGVITASGGIGSYPATPGAGGTVTSTVATGRNPIVLDLMATGGKGSDLLFKDSGGFVIGGWASSSAVPFNRSILPGTTYGAGSVSGAGTAGAVAIFY